MNRFSNKRAATLAMVVIFAALTFSACGPEQSQRSKTNAQNDQYALDESSRYAPLVGKYVGTYTQADGTAVVAMLNLVPTTYVVANGGANQAQQVPSLGGSFFICGKKSACSSDDQTDLFTVAQFSQAYYTPSNNNLQLFSTSVPNSGSFEITAIVNGDHITGRIFNSVQTNSGTIDLTRVNQ